MLTANASVRCFRHTATNCQMTVVNQQNNIEKNVYSTQLRKDKITYITNALSTLSTHKKNKKKKLHQKRREKKTSAKTRAMQIKLHFRDKYSVWKRFLIKIVKSSSGNRFDFLSILWVVVKCFQLLNQFTKWISEDINASTITS